LGPGRSFAPSEKGAEAADGFPRLEARPRLIDDERFGRSRRLVRGSDARRVLMTGRRIRRGPLDIHWAPGEAGHPRMGLIVPRFQQTAVARNRLRRRLKELWRRELRLRLPAWDVVIRTRREAYAASFAALRADLLAWCLAAASP
jgi:ribonuclease P protein component